MRRRFPSLILCIALLPAIVCAQTITVVLDSLGGPYAGGPIGPVDDDWTFFGYGPPSYNYVESGLSVDDDNAQGWRFPDNLAPGSYPEQAATIAYYQTGYNLHDRLADLGAPPPVAGEPVTLTASFYGFHGLVDTEDPMFSPDIRCFIRPDGIDRDDYPWDMPPLGGEEWHDVTSVIPSGVAPDETFILVIGFDFNTSWYDPQYQTSVIVDRVTATYTPEVVENVRLTAIESVATGAVQMRWEPSAARHYRLWRQNEPDGRYDPAAAWADLGELFDIETGTDPTPPAVGAYYRVEILD